jgi:undecaprenyl-diphosphatase
MFNIFIPFDSSVLDLIQQHMRSDFLDVIMSGLTFFGEKGLGFIVIGLLLLIPRKTRRGAAAGLVAMLIGALVGELALKHFFCRPRPFVDFELVHGYPMPFELPFLPSGYSFPSGHACAAFAFAVSLFYSDKRLGIAGVVLASMVAFSRLYLYHHYPTDVIAGILLGTLCALVTIAVFKRFKIDEKLLKNGRRRTPAEKS